MKLSNTTAWRWRNGSCSQPASVSSGDISPNYGMTLLSISTFNIYLTSVRAFKWKESQILNIQPVTSDETWTPHTFDWFGATGLILSLVFHLFNRTNTHFWNVAAVTSTILLLPLVITLCDMKTASSVATLCFSKSNFLTWNKKTAPTKRHLFQNINILTLHGCFLTQLTLQQIRLCSPAAAAAAGDTTRARLSQWQLKVTQLFKDVWNCVSKAHYDRNLHNTINVVLERWSTQQSSLKVSWLLFLKATRSTNFKSHLSLLA